MNLKTHVSRRSFLGALGAVVAASVLPARHAQSAVLEVTVYMSPSCGCCGEWLKHMRANGFQVQAQYVEDVVAIKRKLGVPQALWSCHTGLVDGYVLEGHVPAADVRRLLRERPAAHGRSVIGLAVPGMPAGAPGMEQGAPQRYSTLAFGADGSRVFSRH